MIARDLNRELEQLRNSIFSLQTAIDCGQVNDYDEIDHNYVAGRIESFRQTITRLSEQWQKIG
jgi:hypothetical protein